ncbi:Non-canonical poly(A) RNA polymerase [Lachnellula suecica]|uniref:polynucleotide adenylyltransferase n=1 Tax=Lachnellula suecica TaxID=602035 RepID=A0A8T9C2R1_9HELO|nr:Non-canonical poly(A) RNA polymerase [Lachnellula suecica]
MSRQPPPAPRPSGQSYRPGRDSQRPSNDNYYPRNNENNPPYSRAPQDMYQFNAGHGNDRDRSGYDQRGPPGYDSHYATDSYAPGAGPHRNSDSYRPREEFNFQYDAPSSLNFDHGRGADYRPRSRSPPPRQPYRESNGYNPVPASRDRAPLRSHNNQRGGARGGWRGGARVPKLASDRAFLQTNRAPTPELMPGMDEDAGTVRYKAVDDMSDSDEADMDVSDDESGDEAQQPRKKVARTNNKTADGDSAPTWSDAPKWSNPDPYTALPPPDESQRKKKDVVKLIRKARVTNSAENTVKPVETDDFISFDFGDDQAMDLTDEVGNGVPGAPTGPRTNQTQLTNNLQLRDSSHTQNKPRDEPSRSSALAPTTSYQEPSRVHALPPKPMGPNTVNGESSRVQVQLPTRPPKKSAAVIDLTSDPNLGSRKRNVRDEIRGPPKIHGRPGRGVPSKGHIVDSWKVRPDSPATPWIGMDHSKSANMGLWLHKEIMDFYHYVKPRDFEQTIRENLVVELGSQIMKHSRGANTKSFGSFPAGLYLPTSDMDIVCVSDDFLTRGYEVLGRGYNAMRKFASFLEKERIPLPGSVEVISKAKVPIIKYMDRLTGLKVDISFENKTGLVANGTFQEWKKEFPAMPILVTLIKHLLAMRGLNEPATGGIGGFSVICLVVSLLQNMPQVQSRNMIPEHHLGEILMEFFDLYGNQLNVATTAISMKPPGYVRKDQVRGVTYRGKGDKLSIIDPNTPTNDISGGASSTSKILEFFSNAYRDLQKRMGELQSSPNRAKESILGCILAGNYTSFELQRKHLAHVHEKLVGPIQES